MLSSLSVLPKEIKEIIAAYAVLPECVKVIDKASFDEKAGMHGGVYVVLRNDVKLWESKYQSAEAKSMQYLSRVWEEAWDTTYGVMCTCEEDPLYFSDLEDYVEGVDYRVLSVADALREVGYAVS